jgi:hypothetical protein
MKAAGFDPERERFAKFLRKLLDTPEPGAPAVELKTTRREIPGEWAQRMIEQARKVDVITLDSCAEIDWDAYERTRQHCKETERE